MQTFDDGDRHGRWIFRLLVLLALIVGVAAFRDEVRGDDGTDTGSAARPGSAPIATTGPHGTVRTAPARVPELPTPSTGGLRLEGLVVDQDDEPVGGARVVLGGQREVTTEADGSFAFDALAEGEYDLVAERGDWFAELQDTSLDETSDPVKLQLGRGPTLVVTIVDEAGHPLAGAKVHAAGLDRVTGTDGEARFRAVELDDETVFVSMAGRAAVRDRVKTSDDPKAIVQKTIVLQSGAEITGIVIDHTGARVADAYVELEPSGGGRTEMVWSDEQGAFQLPDIGKGAYVLKASSKIAIPAASIAVEHDGVHRKAGLVLTVKPGGEIHGIVVDQAGKPVAGACVLGGGSLSEETGPDGRFVAKGLLPDKYELSVSSPLLGARDTTVQLGAGQRLDVRIVLVPSSLAGIVVDARGEPVEGASVFARSETPEAFTYATTDEHGRFDLGGLPPSAHYKVSAQREESRVEGPAIDVASGNRQLRLTVHDPAAITGRVMLDGAPLPYFGFAVTEKADELYTRPTPVRDPAGRFTIKDAAPGKVVVVLVGPGFTRKVIENVEVVSGQTTDLGTIFVERGDSIRGRVVDDRGVVIPGATVSFGTSFSSGDSAMYRRMQGEVSATSDANGDFELVGIPPATEERVLRASHATRGASPPTLVPAGQTTIELVVQATGGIRGSVAGRDGIYVLAERDGDPDSVFGDLDVRGGFEIQGLLPGTYQVKVRGLGRFAPIEVQVVAGATATVTFEKRLPDEPGE